MSDKKMDFGEGGSIPADQHDHHNAEAPPQKKQRTEAAGSTTNRGGESKLPKMQEQLTRIVSGLRKGFVDYANKTDNVSLRMHGWSKKQHWGCLEHLGMQPYVIKASECPLEKVVCDPVHSGSDFGRQKFVANFAFPGMGKTMGMFLQTRQCLESHPSAHAVFVTFNGDHQPLDSSESCGEFPDQVAGFGWRLLHSALFNGALNSDNPDSASRFANQTIEFRKSLMCLKGLALQDYIATTRLLLGMEPEQVLVVVLDEIGKFIRGNGDSVPRFVLRLNEQLVQHSAKLFVSLVYQKQFAELFRQSQGQIEFHNVGPLPMSRVLPDFFCTTDSVGKPTGKALFSDKLIALSKLAARGYHGRTVRAWMAASQDEGAKFNPATHLAADQYWQIEKVMRQDFLEDGGQSSINRAVWEAFDLESDDTDHVLTSVQKGRWSLQYCREQCKHVALVPPVLLVHETLPKHYPAHFPEKERIMGLDEVTYRLGLALMSVPSHSLKLDGEIWGPESFEFIRRHNLPEYRSHLGEGKLFEETMMYWLLGQILNSSGKSRKVSNLFLLDHISPGMKGCGSIKVPCSDDVAFYRPYVYGKDGKARRETTAEVRSRIRGLVGEKKVCCVVPDGKHNRPQDFSIIFDSQGKLYCFHFQCKEKVDAIVETSRTNTKGFRELIKDFEELQNSFSLGDDVPQEHHFILCSVNHDRENLPDDVNCSVISLVASEKQTGETSTGRDHSLGRCMLRCPTLQYSMSYLLKGEFHPSPATSPNHAVAKLVMPK